MAILRVTVLDTDDLSMHVYSSSTITPGIAGNIGAKISTYPYTYDTNNPRVPNAIGVFSYHSIIFDSSDLFGDAGLVGQLAADIEAGIITVADDADPGVPLTRADLEEFISP